MTGTYEDAKELQREIGLIDLHLDSLLQSALFGYKIDRKHRAGFRGQPLFWHADLPRMREAGYAGACMGVHGWPYESEKVWRAALRQIDTLDVLCTMEPDCIRLANNGAWSDLAKGKLQLTAGVEGAHILNGRLDRARELAQRGVSYLTLTHFSKNSAATPSMGRGANESDGLSPFGIELVIELNRAGIAVDVSHSNERCTIDACEVSSAPVFATHSGLQTIYPHRRLLSERAALAIKETGGVIGVIFAPGYLGDRWRANTEVVADHAIALLDLVGEDHVAVGTDLDGWLPSIPNNMRDCRDTPRLIQALLRRGVSRPIIRKILRDNAIRAFREVYLRRADQG